MNQETMNGYYTTDGTGLAVPIGIPASGNRMPAGLRTLKLQTGYIHNGATYVVWLQHNSLEPGANPTTWTDVYADSSLLASDTVTAGTLTLATRNLCSYTTDTRITDVRDLYTIQVYLAPGYVRGRIIVSALVSGSIALYLGIF